MSRLMTFASIVLVLISFGFVRAGDPFENTKWKINLVCTDGGAKDETDTISFKGGKFKSEVFEKRGFNEANFDEDVRRGSLGSYTAEQTSDKQGKLKWTGTITATATRGDLLWTKPDGTEIRYSFNGERLSK